MNHKGPENCFARIAAMAGQAVLGAMMAVVVLMTAGCGAHQEPFVIGAVLSLTGKGADDGKELKNGLELAIDEVNQWGGVNGRKVVLEARDTGGDRDRAIQVFHALVREAAPALVVSQYSYISMALAPLARTYQTPLVGCITSTSRLARHNPWCFRLYTSAREDVAPALSTIRHLGIRTLGLIYVDDPFGREMAAILRSEIADEMDGFTAEKFSVDARDFSGPVQAVMAMEAVYIVGWTGHLAGLIRQIRSLGYPGHVLGPADIGVTRIRTMPETAGIYVAAPAIYNPGFRLARKVKKRYEIRYNRPFDLFAANGYDLVKIVAGLLEGQDMAPADVRARLASGFSYTGVSGQFSTSAGERDILFPLRPARVGPDGSIRYRTD